MHRFLYLLRSDSVEEVARIGLPKLYFAVYRPAASGRALVLEWMLAIMLVVDQVQYLDKAQSPLGRTRSE